MAAFVTTSPAVGSFRLVSSLSKVVHTMSADVVAWNNARKTRKLLSKLSERELDDIGLCRADIWKI